MPDARRREQHVSRIGTATFRAHLGTRGGGPEVRTGGVSTAGRIRRDDAWEMRMQCDCQAVGLEFHCDFYYETKQARMNLCELSHMPAAPLVKHRL